MLVFHLKKEWFEKIKSGEKTHEYREKKPYWTTQLMFLHAGDLIVFRCGYCKAFDPEKELLAEVVSVNIIYGLNSDLKIAKPVYDIEFELVKEGKKNAYWKRKNKRP